MGKFNKQSTKFNAKLLRTLKDNKKSGVEVHTTVEHLAIHPCQLKNFKESVKYLLNEKVAKYNNTYNGILLGYQNIKLIKDEGVIHDDSCYIHFDIQADFYVFKPEIGKIMQGIVIRKSKDHLAILVYDVFNVSIPIFDEDGDNNLGVNVNIGDEITFQIIYINLASHLPYIRGKIVSPSETSFVKSGDTSSDKVTDDDDEPPKKKKKKHKKVKIAVVGENF